MTSKISFFNLRLENIKHRLGMILIVSGMFFIYMLSFVISVQNICGMEGESAKEIISGITQLAEPGGVMGTFSVLSAILLAVSGFRFLHSKTETDFYHSLPVRRRSEFYLILTNDTAVFLALFVLVSVFKCGVVALTGYFSALFAANTLWSLLCCALMFEVSYLTMTLAMIMTGNTFVGLLGYGVFASYSPLIMGELYGSLARVFYSTYYSEYSTGGGIFDYFSPVSLANGLFTGNIAWVWKEHISYLVVSAVWVVVLLVINFLLFERRASEMAGKAMAFPKTRPVIRILLVIPAAIYGGQFLYSVSFTEFKPWIIVGMAVGGFLTHGVIECIYSFDIRGLLAYKKQMLISMAAAFVIVAFFWLDISGYDSFLPEKEETASIVIDRPGIADDTSFWGKERNGLTGETMEGTLKVLEEVVGQNGRSMDSGSEEQDDGAGYENFVIRYRMKNGKEKIRQYVLSPDLTDELMGQVFDTQEYKRDTYSLYTADWSNVTGVEVWSPMKNQTLELTKEQRAELFRTYLEEHAKLDYKTAKSELPFGQLMVTHTVMGYNPENLVNAEMYSDYTSEETDSYFLYPCFAETIRYLTEELKLDMETSMKKFDIIELEATRYNDGDVDSVVIKDEEFIKSVKDKLVYGEYLWNAGLDTAIDMSYDIAATIKTETGTEIFPFYTDRETIEKIKKHGEQAGIKDK